MARSGRLFSFIVGGGLSSATVLVSWLFLLPWSQGLGWPPAAARLLLVAVSGGLGILTWPLYYLLVHRIFQRRV